MPTIALPGPVTPYRLRPTLSLVTAVEETGGNIFKLADQLLQHELQEDEIIRLLLLCYAAAGCDMTADETAIYLRTASPVKPAHILGDILVHVLAPLFAARAVEESPAGKKGAAEEKS